MFVEKCKISCDCHLFDERTCGLRVTKIPKHLNVKEAGVKAQKFVGLSSFVRGANIGPTWGGKCPIPHILGVGCDGQIESGSPRGGEGR